VIDLFAASRVAVLANPGDTRLVTAVSGTPLPFRVWSWQARDLAAETASGSGLPGSVIDQLAPVPGGVLPTSYLLAGYISGANTVGARALRLYMGSQDWHHPQRILFPTLALALLASDVAASAAPGAGQSVGSTTQTAFITGPGR
jgi:hypothetical protein